MWQRVSTSKGHLQGSGTKYIRGNAHNCDYVTLNIQLCKFPFTCINHPTRRCTFQAATRYHITDVTYRLTAVVTAFYFLLLHL